MLRVLHPRHHHLRCSSASLAPSATMTTARSRAYVTRIPKIKNPSVQSLYFDTASTPTLFASTRCDHFYHRRTISPWNNTRGWNSSSSFFSSLTSDGSNDGPSSSSSNGNGSGALIVPSKVGYGDDAPRFPHLLALPVLSRPLFPGIVTTITLTDEVTIRAIESFLAKKTKKNGSSATGSYVGVFLRKKGGSSSTNESSSNTHSSLILEQPERITDPQDLYTVGTFAQIHRITRGGGGGAGEGISTESTQKNGSSSSDAQGTSNNSTHQKNATKDSSNMNRSSTDEQAFGSFTVQEGEEEEDEEDPSSQEAEGDPTSENEDILSKGSSSASLLLLAHRRIDLISVDNIGPPIHVTVKHWERMLYRMGLQGYNDDTIKALSNEILSTIREIATINPLFREHVTFFPSRIDASDPYRLADFAASLTTGSPEELQAVLEERDPELRLHKALVLLSKEREVSKLQQEISRKVEEKMTEAQRRYFLTEQLKSIKKELGMEKDDKEALIAKYRKKMAEVKKESLGQEVSEVIESEIEKLSTLEKNSSEFNMTRSYLDWLTSVPWGVSSKESFDISESRKILDRDHYGLDEVKDTILQFIAVGKLKGSIQGKILCLAGPPGVGKTSIAESIAQALGRKFYRFSVGGLSDVSEIKGHRRTYIGAMPGKIIQCLKSVGTDNPLVLIDEIDKLGRGYRGDPASALLEVLDPSQNSGFRDYYLDVPVDISKVLFMCTANDIENIPGPLLDRMEVIRLSGYDVPEKVAIAEQYLVPKSMRDNGLMVAKPSQDAASSIGRSLLESNVLREGVPESLSIQRSAIESLVRWYCREAGVRNLNKHIEKITRKLALQIVAEGEGAQLTKKSTRKSDTWVVSETNLHEYVGKPIFTNDRMYEKDPLPHGIVMGLAWTSMGGSALYIETQAIKRGMDKDGKQKGGGTLKVTGQLGNVMEESTQIAYTVARSKLATVNAESSYFDDMDVHLHVPEGATPKDGPSAGITIVTALLSLAMDKPVRNDLAMTGEISLTGKVLPVGGIKEKTMAARRAGIKYIILPSANKRDYDEMPDYLKENLVVNFADDYDSVFKIAFGEG